MSEPVIQIEGLSKAYRTGIRGGVQAVNDVSLSVEAGQVVAFVGPNGAGKTTTLFALLGLVHPDKGTLRVFGEPAGSYEARRRTGVQTEIFHTYKFKTAAQTLRFYGTLSGMSESELDKAVPEQLNRLGLAAAANRKVEGFSKGMMQRLGLAQALLHRPDLLILDEPSTGLDPEGRKLVSDLILEEKARGATVLLSSHILSDVERSCDHLFIVSGGKLVYSASMKEIHSTAQTWEIEVSQWTPEARDVVQAASLQQSRDGTSILRCAAADKQAILKALLTAGAEIGAVRRAEALEELYMRYAGGTSHG